jgi:hypothetical protein
MLNFLPEPLPAAAFAAVLPVTLLVDEVRVAEPLAAADELPDDPGGGGLGSDGSSDDLKVASVVG